MKPIFGAIAATTILIMLAPQPLHAADDLRDHGMPERTTSIFAGANVRLSIGASRREVPTARLQLGVTHSWHDRRSASPPTVYRVTGVELGASSRGAPTLSVAGMEPGQLERRLGVSTAGAVAIGAGVVLLAVVAVAAAAGPPDDLGWFEE